MGKKKEYKEANRRFLKNLSFQEGVFALPCPHRQQDRAGDVAAVVLVLLPHIQDDDLLGVHHLFGLLLGDLLVSIRGVSAAPGQQQKR